MIDIHSHIIYGVDDGSKSKEETLEMLKISAECGVTDIVATPHFIRGIYEVEYNEIKEKVKIIQQLAVENNLNIAIHCGQEVHYSEKIFEYYNEGYIGTINNSRYMLIELPMREFVLEKVIEDLYELTIRGVVPIIAHPERYIPFIKNPQLINKLIDEGYLFQLNIRSISGEFGSKVKKLAKTFYDNNIYSFIGSDGHNMTKRTTDMSVAREVIAEESLKQYIENSKDMLADKEVYFKGNNIKKKRNLLTFFK